MTKKDGMCEKHGGCVNATLEITDVHTKTFASLLKTLQSFEDEVADYKIKSVLHKKKRILLALAKKVPLAEAEILANQYKTTLEKQPANLRITFRGCVLTKHTAVDGVISRFIQQTSEKTKELTISPFVGSPPNNTTMKFLVGMACQPGKLIGYQNLYDPLCCVDIDEQEAQLFCDLVFPNLGFSSFCEHALLASNAYAASKGMHGINPGGGSGQLSLWNSVPDEQDAKRLRTV